VADFNRDSWPDLVVASFNPIELGPTSTVSVFIANGAGGGLPAVAAQLNFNVGSTRRQIGVGEGPISLATADFNNDGNPDFAVANSESNSVSIALGPPPFQFAPSTTIPEFDNAPWSLQVADFNSDGDDDLAVVLRYSNNVRIFLGTGAGGFIEMPRVATCSQPVSVAVGDFNDDSRPDLAVACRESANVNLYQGRGDGNFDFTVTIDAASAAGVGRGTVNVTDVVAGRILSGPATTPGADECDDIAFLVAPNTPVPPGPGTVVVQPVICAP
jgi:hypothetical protein